MRRRLVPGDEVTFIVDRNVNYTNVCVSGCRFCAFYRSAEDSDAYVLTREELAAKVAETIDLDGTAILLQGGMHPDLGHRVVRDDARRHQGRPPEHPRARLRTSRDRPHRAHLGHHHARGAVSAERGRARLAAGRRRRDPRRPRARTREPQEGHERRVARRHARGSSARHLHHRDHDVRRRRDGRGARRAHGARARGPGRGGRGRPRRLPRVHPVELPAGQHRAGRGRVRRAAASG